MQSICRAMDSGKGCSFALWVDPLQLLLERVWQPNASRAWPAAAQAADMVVQSEEGEAGSIHAAGEGLQKDVCLAGLGFFSWEFSLWFWTNRFGFAFSKFEVWSLNCSFELCFFESTWKLFLQISFCQGTAISLTVLLMRYFGFSLEGGPLSLSPLLISIIGIFVWRRLSKFGPLLTN